MGVFVLSLLPESSSGPFQVWGAAGMTHDFPLGAMYTGAGRGGIADGPEEVQDAVAKNFRAAPRHRRARSRTIGSGRDGTGRSDDCRARSFGPTGDTAVAPH
jgi:hypothetical protein